MNCRRPIRAAKRSSTIFICSFSPDAKIGILGVNGSGKSTLMKIMAGIDKEFTGEAWAAKGATVGYLHQEPPLNEKLDVLGNVMLGVAPKTALLTRYNEIAAQVAEEYTDELMEEMTTLQDSDRRAGSLGSRQPGRNGDGRAARTAG